MRVAIVHDYIKEFGGAERVLEVLTEVFPDAPIYTAFYSPSFLGPHEARFKKFNIKTTWFQYIPFKNKLLSYFRLIAPIVFSSMDLSSYDVVITSATGTYTSPNFVKISAKTKLICYCHTPPRYLYGYATAAPWKSVWWRKLLYVLGQLPMHFLRLSDFKAAQKPDFFIANSEEVSQRIKKFYRRDSTVIYPPLETKSLVSAVKSGQKGEYYLAGGRLARPKHVELAVLACTKLKLPLKVFGREFSGYGKELHEFAGPTVEFLGEVSDEKKWELYQGAKAFFFPAEDEDFGIMPVEAMSVGTPVIAYESGGVKETVVDGKTGVFFDRLTTESLSVTLNRFEKLNLKAEDCAQQAQKFSKERFKKEIKEFVESKLI
jgi:glycosyltransferase involved in cell wall biosynthesis